MGEQGCEEEKLTFLDAVLVGLSVGLGVGDSLHALVKVVLGGGALLRVLAFCVKEECQLVGVTRRSMFPFPG
jgi:hypothetical protein